MRSAALRNVHEQILESYSPVDHHICTRRIGANLYIALYVSMLEKTPPADHKGLPLAHVRVSVDGKTLTVSWSDYAHPEKVTLSCYDPQSGVMLTSRS